MLSGLRTRISGVHQEQAIEQERQRDSHFQVLDSSSLENDPIACYEALTEEFCLPTSAHEIDQEMVLLPSGLKSESQPLGWEVFFGVPSPKSLSSEPDFPQYAMKPSDFSNSLHIDSAKLETTVTKHELVEKQEHIGVAADSTVRARKRSCEDAFATESVENDVPAKQRAKTDTDKQEKTRTQYACPFQKLDPVKHHECLKYALHRIKDVKQHVYRRHKQPDYYCARCFVVFPTADARDEHARSKDCENKKASHFEGITDVEKAKLNKSPSRGLDAQEQWFTMWEIIFPGKQKPNSALVGSYMEEMVPVLRSLWTRKNSSILARAQRDQASPMDLSLMNSVVELIFDSLEAEASTSLAQEMPGNGSQTEYRLGEGESPVLTEPPTGITESPGLLYPAPPYFSDDVSGETEPEFHLGSRVAFGEG
ncbi:hypothetical protein KVR01_007517 [Diaporthe batatas]|uniref:uncharacterized protein n=1 Tax=Diaporthe batatas TaxID=748121 RepID=UPI001D046B5B|nr:uncharacterized protein KVR01_007517 [Diaporthe batatas]KAG8163039.1 hypothetical protein KVR01_007517 [Diaporthe batatas]